MAVQVLPEAAPEQLPEPYCGAERAAHVAPWQTGKADQEPAVHVSVVEPEMTPLGQEMVHVPPLGVMLHNPEAYCVGGLVSAGHDGLLQTGKADHRPLVHVSVAEPDCTP